MKYNALVALFFVFVYLLPLGGRPMITPDEFRYAQIPREMTVSGDYVVPHLMNMRYFEKPVMGYWLTAGSFKLFGQNAFALRLPAALGVGLAALLIAMLIEQTLRDEKIAALGAMLYLSCGLVYGIGTTAVLDSQLTGFVTGVSCAGFLAALETKFTRRKFALLIVCGIFAALAFLTKGFIAFAVPALALAGFLLWSRRWKEFLILPWIPLIVSLLLIAPWAIAVHHKDGDFWHYFVVIEHIQRFLSDNVGQHPEPFWFLLPFLAGGAFPAAFLLSAAIPGIRLERKTFFRQDLFRFSFCAVVLPFVFFSFSSGKLATYILPCFPFLAIMGAEGIAAYFRTGGRHKAFHLVMSIWGGILAVAGLGVLTVAFADLLPEFSSLRIIVGLLGVCAIIFGGLLLFSHRYMWRTRFYLFFAGIGVVIMVGNLAIPAELLGSKAPESALKSFPQKLNFDASKVILLTHPSLIHAVGWVYNRPDARLENSVGEFSYGISRAEAVGEMPIRVKPDEFIALLKRSDRPEVVLVFRADRDWTFPVDLEYRTAIENGLQAFVFPPAPQDFQENSPESSKLK
ncbi:MAG: phospholipid carrier-dependent glycosyltransferase [Victivallales bacterium]|jgi:4-amino-4-deoxy-L-arabinose transferase|nr:phospholipid carrier-dependent glycosyltransferase [Victivallales bacterium]